MAMGPGNWYFSQWRAVSPGQAPWAACHSDAFRTEDGFDPLRARDDFRLPLLDLAFPANPLGVTTGSPYPIHLNFL
jgi:hypothetical protein